MEFRIKEKIINNKHRYYPQFKFLIWWLNIGSKRFFLKSSYNTVKTFNNKRKYTSKKSVAERIIFDYKKYLCN